MNILHSLMLSLFLLLSACSGETPTGSNGKSPQQRVSVVTAELRDLDISESLIGSLEARRSASISNQQPGMVARILAYPGDTVKQGQLLAQLDDKLLAAQLDKADAALAQARLDAQRAEALASNKLISEDALARARTALALAEADARLARVEFDYSRITAPFDGVISERLVEEGDVLATQTPMFVLLDTRNLKARVMVSEKLLGRLTPGDKVHISQETPGQPVREFSGRISRVPPGLDLQTRQGEIEIEISPAPAGVLPGQLCRVSLQGRSGRSLMIDFDALRHDQHGAYVYVIRADQAHRISVMTGLQQDRYIEILQGLNPGDRVVNKGFTGLHDGQAVSIIQTPP